MYRGDGLNLYAYVQNNPIKYVDPSGYVCEDKYNLYKKFREMGKTPKEAQKLANDVISLPEFNGKTSGVLIPLEPGGEAIPIVSGNKSNLTRYPFDQADGHVETKAAIIMNERGIDEAIVFHNNPKGTCPNCDRYLPTYLDEGRSLTVYPPENAVAPKSTWKDKPTSYTGNNKSPYKNNNGPNSN